jgi:hypothetical protein
MEASLASRRPSAKCHLLLIVDLFKSTAKPTLIFYKSIVLLLPKISRDCFLKEKPAKWAYRACAFDVVTRTEGAGCECVCV